MINYKIETGSNKYKTIVTIPASQMASFQDKESPLALAQAFEQSTWAHRCVSIRANLLSTIPWAIRKLTLSEDEEEILDDHPLYDLIGEMDGETNYEDTIRAVEADLCIFGTGYIQKVRSGKGGSGKVLRLRRLNASTMKVKADASGIIGFEQQLGSAIIQFPREDILYFKEYSPTNDLGGLSMVKVALPAIQALTNTERYLTAFFENYALPAAIVTTEQQLGETDFSRLQRWWQKTFGGAKNAHKVGIMDKGAKIEQFGFNLTDLALEQVRETCRRDICGVFGVPPSLAGAWESANYATALEERRSIYTETIIPRARYLQSVINSYLAQEVDPTVEFVFLFDELEVMQPDKKMEAEIVCLLVSNKIIKPEVGALELGYTEEDVPEETANPIPPQLLNYTGLPDEEIEKRKEQPESEVANPEKEPLDEEQMKAELRSWKRKSLKKFKASNKADVEFISQFIPDALKEAIEMQLKVAENVDEINSIFTNARMFQESEHRHMKADIEEEVKDDVLDRVESAVKSIQINPVINVQPTPVTVAVEPTPIKVNVAPADVRVEPVVNVPETKVVIKEQPKKRRVVRDAQTQRIIGLEDE